ncbi:hypothetical protein [Aureivirga sp. CE67]|uniref:hypothetical protein n=1 Tax=Aureivirga sp. CE67 TaxID=1788983 RepID=UPI0018C9B1F5|nr:hypothetical protein [Aureivirga sp. CE67]
MKNHIQIVYDYSIIVTAITIIYNILNLNITRIKSSHLMREKYRTEFKIEDSEAINNLMELWRKQVDESNEKILINIGLLVLILLLILFSREIRFKKRNKKA